MRIGIMAALLLAAGCTSPNHTTVGGGTGKDGGSTGTSPGTISGGTTGLLKFAVFGDCRPANLPPSSNLNDVSGYPLTIVSTIFTMAQAGGAQFMIGTGDYMYASADTSVTSQIGVFNQARDAFKGPFYLGMGNHECTGATASNCPNYDETPNVKAYMAMLPKGITTPYYRLDFDTPKGTAKFLFVAANGWSTTQETWLQDQLADATTYTFVIRHEPTTPGSKHDSSTAPGANPSETLLSSAAYTLELLGHSHEYQREDTKHVISGNAGAPVDNGSNYGFLMIEQQSDGTILATEYDESTGMAIDTWKLNPDGTAA
jgi:hypothetical protein